MTQERWRLRKVPATWATFWVLLALVAGGILLLFTTRGVLHLGGVALVTSCGFAAVQIIAVLRRGKGHRLS